VQHGSFYHLLVTFGNFYNILAPKQFSFQKYLLYENVKLTFSKPHTHYLIIWPPFAFWTFSWHQQQYIYTSNIKKLTTHLWMLFIHPFMDFFQTLLLCRAQAVTVLLTRWLKSPQRLPKPNFLYDMHLQGIMVVVFIKNKHRSSPRWLTVWTKASPLKTPCFRTYSHNIYCNNSKMLLMDWIFVLMNTTTMIPCVLWEHRENWPFGKLFSIPKQLEVSQYTFKITS